jgi:integrase
MSSIKVTSVSSVAVCRFNRTFSLGRNFPSASRSTCLAVTRWRGWHAFRRGLGTILYGLGVPAETAKVILRHSAVAVTQKHYIKLKSAKEGRAAMNKLEKAIAKSRPLVGRKKSGSART